MSWPAAAGGGASPPMHRRPPAGRRAPGTAGGPPPRPERSCRRRLPAPGPPPAGGDGEPRGAGKGRRRAGPGGRVGRRRKGREGRGGKGKGTRPGPARRGGCRCGRWLRQAHPAAHRRGGSVGPAPPCHRKRSPDPCGQSRSRRWCRRMRTSPRHAAGSHLGEGRGAGRGGGGQGGKVHSQRCASPRPSAAAHAREALPAREEAAVGLVVCAHPCQRSGGNAPRGAGIRLVTPPERRGFGSTQLPAAGHGRRARVAWQRGGAAVGQPWAWAWARARAPTPTLGGAAVQPPGSSPPPRRVTICIGFVPV